MIRALVNTGQIRAQPVLPHRINGQFIMEGLTAGFMYTAAGMLAFLLPNCHSPHTQAWP